MRAVPERLHGLHLGPVGVERERQAGEHRAAVDHHRARAAVALVAALLGADEIEIVAERLEQRAPRVDGELDRLAGEAQRERHQALDGARPWAAGAGRLVAGGLR